MELRSLDLERFAAGGAIAPAAPPSAAATARRFRFLTADGQLSNALEQEALLGTNDLVDTYFLERCLLVRRAIGRIKIVRATAKGWATGFLIAPGLLMTNHHVFPESGSVGASRIAFDYWCDVAGQPPTIADEFDLRPDLFFVANKDLDYAVVAIGDKSAFGAPIRDRAHIRLMPETGKVKQDEFVTILQHPEGEPMQVALRENKVIRVGEDEPFIWYAADTAHGSSGAPVFNDSYQLVALHASGRIKRENGRFVLKKGGTTDKLDGLSETDVVWEANVGFRVSRITGDLLEQAAARWPARLPEIENAMRGGDVMSGAIAALKGKSDESAVTEKELKGEDMSDTPKSRGAIAAGGSSVVIPLQLRISLEAGGAVLDAGVGSAPDQAAVVPEAFEMRMPIIYDRLGRRPGFKRNFLGGDDVPMPKITEEGEEILAPLLNGSGHELKYRHFSVWMHSERRLALLTAANVDWRNRRKTVDGKSTARKALAGFPPNSNYAELWASDPRIDAAHQLPDTFYSEDKGAFDKGHIVRRDDVCWGQYYEEIQMANGDTYHVTNCSPQIKAFNQGQHGEENWGDLENAVASITREEAEAACLFAGPVFRADDRWFNSKDDNGSVRVQIPTEFWKIVVVKNGDAFKAYAFVLEQDVRKITEEEFYVTDEWLASWKPISYLQEKMRGWLDLSDLAAIDQHQG